MTRVPDVRAGLKVHNKAGLRHMGEIGVSWAKTVPADSCCLLYALSQGDYSGNPPGSPALPNTGALVQVTRDGSFAVITSGLDRPTSLEFIGSTAYVVTLTGQIWKIDDVSDVDNHG